MFWRRSWYRIKTSTTSHQSKKNEMNGDTTKEIYHYDLK
ncbi:hypothetical protein GJV11_07575 [Enterobacteriaceae bacterium RIT693]|nr:hypothetical protein [Enterobacteriaceae bacterium RIT693]